MKQVISLTLTLNFLFNHSFAQTSKPGIPTNFITDYFLAYSNTPTSEKLKPFYADSVVIDDPSFDWVGQTKESIFKDFDKISANSHFNWNVYQHISCNDTLVAEGLLKATYAGLPYEMRFVKIFHFKDGKIIRQFDYSANAAWYKTMELYNKEKNRQIDKPVHKGIDTTVVMHPDSVVGETAVSLVQRQLNAYNARDIEAFLEPYNEQVELYDYKTGSLILKGKEAMRNRYAFFAKVPELHCELKTRIVQGNIVIDKERITGFGDKVLEATAIYHISDNKIVKVFFIQ